MKILNSISHDIRTIQSAAPKLVPSKREQEKEKCIKKKKKKKKKKKNEEKPKKKNKKKKKNIRGIRAFGSSERCRYPFAPAME